MSTSIRRGRARAAIAALVLTLGVVGAGLAAGTPAQAQSNPYERGPAPTTASIEAERGPFAIAQTTVGAGNGFGGGTIYYPTDTSQGTFGAIALSPGFTGTQSALGWLGPRVASQGFVVFSIDTNSIFDQPGQRADQLQAALDYLVQSSSVRSRIDGSRLAVGGHSMGGGGSIEAARDNPALQAVVAFQPWHSSTSWSGVQVPTMIQGAENDSIAPVASHAEPFYESIPAASEKAYLEINNADHMVSTSPNVTTAKYTIAWLKRFVDNDTRYEQFLCPAPSGSTIQEYRHTCPHGGTTPPTTAPGGTTTTTVPSTTTTTTAPPPACQWWQWWCWFS
jgi:pimeloyl-ACP methyl ester carboxylesterase